jgi:hypothetical protein
MLCCLLNFGSLCFTFVKNGCSTLLRNFQRYPVRFVAITVFAVFSPRSASPKQKLKCSERSSAFCRTPPKRHAKHQVSYQLQRERVLAKRSASENNAQKEQGSKRPENPCCPSGSDNPHVLQSVIQGVHHIVLNDSKPSGINHYRNNDHHHHLQHGDGVLQIHGEEYPSLIFHTKIFLHRPMHSPRTKELPTNR